MTVNELMCKFRASDIGNISLFDEETGEVNTFSIWKTENNGWVTKNNEKVFSINNYRSFLSAFGEREVKYWTIIGGYGTIVLYIDVEKEETEQ